MSEPELQTEAEHRRWSYGDKIPKDWRMYMYEHERVIFSMDAKGKIEQIDTDALEGCAAKFAAGDAAYMYAALVHAAYWEGFNEGHGCGSNLMAGQG